ncbi:hypothetical protein Htur_2401 [Haloterrigena turkmenica DSM 5511]|uniref:Uncharacterized protein n=1 Tax=Haloterrigena turkmenica (strain ATCC 51198 / DSM 5511 / JCM 9101 / NCIMB 13204 / VKM B-1734 / 4k) TaxID=543526 RepID=D2RV78_HALTV|nr:hypothetical protein [Haloterrigena turkmenica]ADB61279.1 hypothetical protein Htur_2401 [Haloterrigena turkmenica DSM 5511]
MPSPSVFDHVWLTDTDHSTGIYRVVGTSDETVTALRVSDADGRRRHTGELVTVSRDELATAEPAENPDGNRSLSVAVVSQLKMSYWMLRAFVGQLTAHPLPTIVAVALVTFGFAGGRIASLPEIVLDLSVIVGCLVLAYVGSGRL